MGNFGGPDWDAAQRAHRITPGRGPLYARRVLPTRKPELRVDALARGVPRSALDTWDAPVRCVVLPPAPDYIGNIRLGPGGHGDEHGPYRWDIITRLRASWLISPHTVVAGWAAAALHGLPYWADSEPVVLLSSRTRRNATGPSTAVFRTLKPGTPTDRTDPLFPQMRVLDAATATAQCLATVLQGKKTWHVPHVPGMDEKHVRAVQLIDAMYQCSFLTARQILAAAHGIVDRRVLTRLLAMADEGAQSPMETVLRLIVRDELPDAHRWTSQVRINLADGTVGRGGGSWRAGGGARSTVPDLACETLGVALYYDGRHHDELAQTDTDFTLFQKLRGVGWEAVRVNRKLLADLPELLEQLRAAVRRACEARAREVTAREG